MEEKANGIVLSSVSVGENDKILNIFTLEKGTVSAKIKGVKKAGAKLKFAAEPFCFAEFVFSASGDKRTVIGASLTDSFYPIRNDVFRFYCGGVVLEFIKRFAKEGLVSVELFLLSVETLKKLAYGKELPQSALAAFIVAALKICGYALDLSGCSKCGETPVGRCFFDWSRGGFFCYDCYEGGGREVKDSTFSALQKAEKGEGLSIDQSIAALRLLEFYLAARPEERINSLKELLKISK